MKSTLYSSLLSRLKNKHSKLSTRFHKSVREGEFQQQRYRKRKDTVERLKSLEKRILGLSAESGVKTSLNYKHWAVALALGAIVATSNPVQAQEVMLDPPMIVGNAYPTNVLRGDLDNDGDVDLIYLSYVDNPIILTNEGGFSFTQSTLPNMNGIINSAELFDLDGDDDLDIFMRNGSENDGYTYQVWQNDGTGNFASQPASLPSISFNDNNVLFADLDNDGDADIILEQNASNDYVRTLVNDGAFNFSGGIALPGNLGRSNLVGVFDVDGDTSIDIAFRGYQSGLYPLLSFINDGIGNFSPGSYAYGVEAGFSTFTNQLDTLDIDGDGDTDLIVETASYPAQFQVFLNDNGPGISTFTPDFSFNINGNNDINDVNSFDDPAGSANDRVFVTTREDSTFVMQRVAGVGLIETAKFPGQGIPIELDTDGDGDAIFYNEGTISTLENQGGSFVQSSDLLSVSTIYDMDTVDIDGDSDLDLITAGPQQSRVWLNDGAGGFTIGQELGPSGKSVAIGDLDNDGDMDLVRGLEGSGYGNLLGFDIWRNDSGTLTVLDTIDVGNYNGKQVFIENLDADADLEVIVFAEYEGDGSSNWLRSFDNDGNFGITLLDSKPLKYEATFMDVGDIDGDTNIDAIVTGGRYSFADTQIWDNDGTGVFTNTSSFDLSNAYPASSAQLSDLDGDGDLDLFTNNQSEHKFWLNDGGSFTILDTLETSNVAEISALGDVDGDGDNDIILGGYASFPTIFLNDGLTTPSFNQDADITAVADEYTTVIAADLDNDGDNDILFGGYYTGLKVLFNQALLPEAEINVQGNGIDIVAGDTTPDEADGTDFGTIAIGDDQTSTFTIQNLGGIDLNISSITVSATNGTDDVSSDFEVTGITAPTIINPSGEAMFSVTYTPSITGVIAGSILIANDDSDEFSYPFGITAIAQTPQEINVQGNLIDIVSGDITPDLSDGTNFGSLVVGNQAISQFEIQNTGEANLEITDIQLSGTNPDDFAIDGISLPAIIGGGMSATFDVIYTASAITSSTATVEITNDDADEGAFTFEVAGSGKAPGILTQDSTALLAIYNNLGGTGWTNNTNWLVDGTRAETWFGVVVENERVTKLFLSNNNLSGTLPTEIGDLTALTDLYMSNNALSGAIPPEIGQTSLDTLVLSGNQLTSLPDEVYDLNGLIRLSISQNELEGTISPNIANLTNLTFVALWDNPFTGGTIPAEFWTMTSLQNVFLGTSNLAGDISGFTNLTNLIEFWVDQSNFTGSISSDIGNLVNLELLDISDNQMTGPIPTELSSLTNLITIELQNNAFTALPDLSGLTNLDTLNVSNNELDFADLEPNASLVSALNYSPQNNQIVPLEISINGELPFPATNTTTDARNAVTITGITGEASNNQYEWLLNETVDASQTTLTYDIPSLGRDEVGIYSLTVTNSSLPDLTFTSDPVEVFANAVISVQALDAETEAPITENLNAYIFPLDQIQIDAENIPDTLRFDDESGLLNVSSTFDFPEVLLGDYLIGVESTVPISTSSGDQNPNATYIPTYYGDEFLYIEADTLFLEADSAISIIMQEFPVDIDPGVGLVSGTIEEDFGDDQSRIDARRRAKKRKCGLRRKRSGGRVNQDDEFELIAYGETNDNGEFEYGFLPQGIYRFFVEYPGIPLDESAFVEFEIGEAGVSDDSFVLAVFASPDGVEIEIVLGLTSDYFTDFSIYPNPTSDVLNIEYSEIKSDRVSMEIISMDGKILDTREMGRLKNQYQYDTSLLPQGMYLIRFRDDSGKDPLVFRVIKK